MSVPRPHFLLFSDASPARRGAGPRSRPGAWRFVLEPVDGSGKLEATDQECCDSGDRLNLLAVVRGLEALDQPSRVTLVTSSRYVARGLRFGLREWRENGWQWERYGQMSPVRNQDLWQRIDRALEYHQLQCRMVGPAAGQWSDGQEVLEMKVEPRQAPHRRPDRCVPTDRPWRRAVRALGSWCKRLLRPPLAAAECTPSHAAC